MQQPFSLIIVDDEQNIAYGLRDLYPWLEWGFSVSGVFLHADDALSHLAVHHVDVVLSDIRMPGTDGLDFARLLHKHYPEILVVLLSAYPDFEYVRDAMRSGVSHYLVKPLRYDRLVSVFSALQTQLMQKSKPDPLLQADHQKIIEYIYRYVDGNLSGANLTEVSANLGFTQGHISRIFSSETGQTFSEYLTSRRMEHAARLLCGPFPTLKDVASWAGYENPQHFSRTFVRHFGITPQQYALGVRPESANRNAKED